MGANNSETSRNIWLGVFGAAISIAGILVGVYFSTHPSPSSWDWTAPPLVVSYLCGAVAVVSLLAAARGWSFPGVPRPPHPPAPPWTLAPSIRIPFGGGDAYYELTNTGAKPKYRVRVRGDKLPDEFTWDTIPAGAAEKFTVTDGMKVLHDQQFEVRWFPTRRHLSREMTWPSRS